MAAFLQIKAMRLRQKDVGCVGTFLRRRPTPEASRRSSRNSASFSSILKSQSFVMPIFADGSSRDRMFSIRRLKFALSSHTRDSLELELTRNHPRSPALHSNLRGQWVRLLPPLPGCRFHLLRLFRCSQKRTRDHQNLFSVWMPVCATEVGRCLP